MQAPYRIFPITMQVAKVMQIGGIIDPCSCILISYKVQPREHSRNGDIRPNNVLLYLIFRQKATLDSSNYLLVNIISCFIYIYVFKRHTQSQPPIPKYDDFLSIMEYSFRNLALKNMIFQPTVHANIINLP